MNENKIDQSQTPVMKTPEENKRIISEDEQARLEQKDLVYKLYMMLNSVVGGSEYTDVANIEGLAKRFNGVINAMYRKRAEYLLSKNQFLAYDDEYIRSVAGEYEKLTKHLQEKSK